MLMSFLNGDHNSRRINRPIQSVSVTLCLGRVSVVRCYCGSTSLPVPPPKISL